MNSETEDMATARWQRKPKPLPYKICSTVTVEVVAEAVQAPWLAVAISRYDIISDVRQIGLGLAGRRYGTSPAPSVVSSNPNVDMVKVLAYARF